MYINKIYRLNNITNCKVTDKYLDVILNAIKKLDDTTDESNKELFFNELKNTISSGQDYLSQNNIIKIELSRHGILKTTKQKNSTVFSIQGIPTKDLEKIRESKCLYFSFSLDDNKKFQKELDKEFLFFVNSGSKLYTVGNKIGQGGNGYVFSCYNQKGEVFAVKIFRGTDVKRKKAFIDESIFLNKNTNENIIKVFDIQTKSSEVLFYVMEKYEETLEQYLNLDKPQNKTYNSRISRDNYFSIVNSLLNAVKDLNDKNLYHTDIKLSNILINKNNNKQIKVVLSDFGCLGPVERNKNDVIGNIDTKAPEAFKMYENNKINVSKHDVYSLGIIFNNILTGQRPVGEGYKKIAERYKDLAFIDYTISIMLTENNNYRPDINFIITMFTLFQDLLKFGKNNFNELINIKRKTNFKTYIKFKQYYFGDFHVGDKKINNDKFGFKIDFKSLNVNKETLCVLDGTDITKYSKHSARMVDDSFVIDAFYDKNLKNVGFYNFNNHIMMIKKYKNNESVVFYDKDRIRSNYNFGSLTQGYNDYLYYENIIPIMNCSNFFVFNTYYIKLNMRIKFLLAYNKPFIQKNSKDLVDLGIEPETPYPERFTLYFLINDYLFPLTVTENIIDRLKKELNIF
jgi:serine/threonine protein kinase